jgi:hypothetical protein
VIALEGDECRDASVTAAWIAIPLIGRGAPRIAVIAPAAIPPAGATPASPSPPARVCLSEARL